VVKGEKRSRNFQGNAGGSERKSDGEKVDLKGINWEA
jgi:hypothetical protein